jgi:uncharacterized membrane protein
MDIIFVNIISLLGLCGFFLSFYIYSKKKAKKKLICPRYSTCDTVIHSDYSKIIGIPVEVLGMVYYAFIGSAYTFIFIGGAWSYQVAIVLLGISLCACLFSLYLVSIQAFVVKHWCVWCLSSALTSILIALFSYLHLIAY